MIGAKDCREARPRAGARRASPGRGADLGPARSGLLGQMAQVPVPVRVGQRGQVLAPFDEGVLGMKTPAEAFASAA